MNSCAPTRRLPNSRSGVGQSVGLVQMSAVATIGREFSGNLRDGRNCRLSPEMRRCDWRPCTDQALEISNRVRANADNWRRKWWLSSNRLPVRTACVQVSAPENLSKSSKKATNRKRKRLFTTLTSVLRPTPVASDNLRRADTSRNQDRAGEAPAEPNRNRRPSCSAALRECGHRGAPAARYWKRLLRSLVRRKRCCAI